MFRIRLTVVSKRVTYDFLFSRLRYERRDYEVRVCERDHRLTDRKQRFTSVDRESVQRIEARVAMQYGVRIVNGIFRKRVEVGIEFRHVDYRLHRFEYRNVPSRILVVEYEHRNAY